jgi:predicted MFS family arabinose efflux permease
MVGLALFLIAYRATDSYGLAGVVVAAFSVGSGALAPLRGRLIDRRGVSPWLPLLASGYGASLVLFVALASVEPNAWLLVLCAAAAGASAPPLVATLRGLWSRTVEQSLLRRAYALTALIGDVGLVVAPALGGLLFVVAPWSPLIVCAVGAVVAAAVITRTASPQTHSPEPIGAPVSPLGSSAMRALLVVSVALGAALGFVEVAVPAAATRWGAAALSGFLLGAFALGSVAGGLWFGRRNWRRSPDERYLSAVFLLALALAPPLLATNSVTLAPLLFIAGLAYGPATISLFEALDAVAPSRTTEALTWVTTAEAAGVAIGAAASGWATASLGTWSPFALASAVLVAATVGAFAWRRRGRTKRRA